MNGLSRRNLILGGVAVGVTALLRPRNQGASYDDYFAQLNQTLKSSAVSHPRLLLDLDRLDANIDAVMSHIQSPQQYRIVVKSLPSMDLLQYVMARSGSRALMAFHQPFLNQLAVEVPDADVLMGKPLPVQAAATFYGELSDSAFDPAAQLQWLMDTELRLIEYQQLAQALGIRMRVSLELDVGLHRGGFEQESAIVAAMERIAADPEHLELGGFMGYEAFIAKLPNLEGNLLGVIERYQAMVAVARAAQPELFTADLTFNIGGSQTYQLYGDHQFFNDISAGSGLVMPTDFEMSTLADHQAACFIATPVLKQDDSVRVPGVAFTAPLFAAWNPNRQQSYYIYGGNWQADYENPPGLSRNPLWGYSSNQEMVNASRKVDLQIGDFVFLRPRQSEALFLQFGDLLGFRDGQLTQAWPVLST
jgi:D-serine deaminase-like pyridoxal phosphate-dependent protein